MAAFKNIIGQRFGNLVAIEHVKDGSSSAQWRCQCDCGNTVVRYGNGLRRGWTLSCGCRRVKHGLHDHPLYTTWKGMMGRCHNPSDAAYSHYGGRGITMYVTWHSFPTFLADVVNSIGERPADPVGWDSSKPYWSIDRIDNDDGYRPGNIRWATWSEQASNRRTVVKTLDGRHVAELYEAQRLTSTDIAEMLGCSADTILKCLRAASVAIRDSSNSHGRFDVDVSQIVELYGQGLGSVDVGRRVGCSADTVVRRLRTAGIAIRPTSMSREARANVRSEVKGAGPWPTPFPAILLRGVVIT